MKPAVPVLTGLAMAVLGAPALGNDTMASLGTGGLVFLTTEEVEMLAEDLYVSAEEVRVRYEFVNRADEDREVLVAFPLPEIKGDGDFTVSIPSEDPANLFGFETAFDGKPVEAVLHQYAFAFGIEYSELLTSLGVPLVPFGEATKAAINALSAADKATLQHLGLVIPMEYDAGQGWVTDYVPVWTLRSAYSWEATFPAGRTVEVTHSYTPSVGGTVAVTFFAEPYDGYDPAADYEKKYCTDEDFLNAVRRTLPDPDDPYGAPFTESWLSYVWSTGANWGGPIGRFHLTVDKGRPENLVSFCWDGEVSKTSPTTFEMEATDFYPPWNRELEILILNRQEPAEGPAG